jgi:hypothetical protein
MATTEMSGEIISKSWRNQELPFFQHVILFADFTGGRILVKITTTNEPPLGNG